MNQLEIIKVTKDGLSISTDSSRLDITIIHKFLSGEAYWSKNIPFEKVYRHGIKKCGALKMRECVAAFIVADGKILLGKRAASREFYPDIWDVFGGHLEPDESREDALRRELAEELGIIPTAFEFLLTVAEPFPEKNGAGEYHFYLVKDFAGEAFNKQPSEHQFVGWFSFAEALKLKFAHPFYAVMIRRFTTCTPISALALSLNSGSP